MVVEVKGKVGWSEAMQGLITYLALLVWLNRILAAVVCLYSKVMKDLISDCQKTSTT